jgi:DhnA family fructose-bisphosphate aldolase class Ia
MALGNANTSAQSRGKNKPVIVKRRKEVVTAKDYNSFNCGTVQANKTNACAVGSLTNTFYHNGAQAQPAVSDIVYSSKRARVPNKMTAGYYQIFDRRKGVIQINDEGRVITKEVC